MFALLSQSEKVAMFAIMNGGNTVKISPSRSPTLSASGVHLSSAQKATLVDVVAKGNSVHITKKKTSFSKNDMCGCGLSVDNCCDWNTTGCSKAHLAYNKEARYLQDHDL